MAKENIAFLVNLRKNIVEGSKMEGRYYPEARWRVVTILKLSLRRH